MVATLGAAPLPPLPKEISVSGTFVRKVEPRKIRDLHGTLTSTGPNEWKAAWTFDWDGKPMSWSGIVKGDLRNGPVTGTGDYAAQKRQLSFEGTAKDGVIKFDHYELTKGRKATGTGEMHIVN